MSFAEHLNEKRALSGENGISRSSRRRSGSTEGADHPLMATSEKDEGDRHHRSMRYNLRRRPNATNGERAVDDDDNEDLNKDDESEVNGVLTGHFVSKVSYLALVDAQRKMSSFSKWRFTV